MKFEIEAGRAVGIAVSAILGCGAVGGALGLAIVSWRWALGILSGGCL